MIEILQGLPDNVVGLVVKGRVTRSDCADVLIPAIETVRKWHRRLRLYYEIRSRYPGAGWEEIGLAGEHAPVWERVAVVSDVAWIRDTVQAVRLLIPSEIRMFSTVQIPEGLAWTTGATVPRQKAPQPAMAAAGRDNGGGRRVVQPPVQYLHHASSTSESLIRGALRADGG